MVKKKKPSTFYITGEVVSQQEGATVVRVHTGFGDPEIIFSSGTITRAEVPK